MTKDDSHHHNAGGGEDAPHGDQSEQKKNKLFCFGYGYCSDYLGMEMQKRGGWEIAGTTRDKGKRALMRDRGIKAFLFDYEQPLEDPHLFFKDVTHLLISTPPNDLGDPAYLMHAEDILHIPTLKWVGYLSSTAVYGNRDGAWVDEKSEVRPSSQRGSRRARAEEQWRILGRKNGLPIHIFRLAGIYGPNRSALDSVRAGIARRIIKEGQVFSRVHVDDVVQTLLASMANPNPGAIYNLCDDEAAPSHEVIAHACEMLGVEPPPLVPFEEANLPPMARSFYADNKRVSNEKIKKELGITLRHPDFESGLQACLEGEKRMKAKFRSDFGGGQSAG